MFLNGASVPHGLVESNTGWRDWAPPGWLRSLRLAAAFRRSLLTVTPSADLHHIAEHFELFPADQTASQNNRREDWQSLLDASSALLKCFSQHPDPLLLVSVWGRQIKCTFSLLCFDVLVDWLLIMFNLINLIDQFEDSHYAGMICYGYAPSGTAVQDSRTAINNSGSQCIMFSCGIVFLWFQYSSRREIGVQRQWKEDKIAGTWNYFVFLQLCSLNLNHSPPTRLILHNHSNFSGWQKVSTAVRALFEHSGESINICTLPRSLWQQSRVAERVKLDPYVHWPMTALQ